MGPDVCYWIISILCIAVTGIAANPALMDNMQLFSMVHWYQLENYRLQLQHRMEVTEYQRQYKQLEKRYNEVHEELESAITALSSARATIGMQASVIRRFVREDQ